MTPALGTLTGTAIVRGPDGQIKSELILTAECTAEQAEALAREILKNHEDGNDGNYTR